MVPARLGFCGKVLTSRRRADVDQDSSFPALVNVHRGGAPIGRPAPCQRRRSWTTLEDGFETRSNHRVIGKFSYAFGESVRDSEAPSCKLAPAALRCRNCEAHQDGPGE